jgi:hypothetical protein
MKTVVHHKRKKVVGDAMEESDINNANEEVNPWPEDAKVEEANVDVTPEQEDANAKQAKEDVASEAIVEKANEDDDTFDEFKGDNVLGVMMCYVLY